MTHKLVCKIGPSILNADLSRLTDECDNLIKCGADYLHLDVMDGHFVPNLTFGAPVVKCLRRGVPQGTFFDMHMMVSNPEQWIGDMHKAGADQYTFHYEATSDPGNCIRKVKETGMRVGLGIKPKTVVSSILEYLDSVDMVLVMTVEPGFGGQSFMDDMLSKVEIIRGKFPVLDIEVDGGVNKENISSCCSAGANWIVSGSAITSSVDKRAVIATLKSNGQSILDQKF